MHTYNFFSSSFNINKPFPINSRGRKRIYTDEERRLRKNYSSKRSRERHTEKVMENKQYLDILREHHDKLLKEKEKLLQQIINHRKNLCGQCLNIVDTALERITNGEDLIVLKCVNWCCANKNRTINIQPKIIINTIEDETENHDEKMEIEKNELSSEIGENI
uniref:BZIP domain-containing protein n=1 Tax=Panagrolaimus sp. JU765 TaxID=591449 RepID=A0AC34QUR4_9BILA